MNFRLGCSILVVLAAGSLGGCGSMEASVAGSVTLDGKPLTVGNVAFTPVSGSGVVANGQIDSSGRYTITTGTEEGLAPGQYTATVVATEISTGGPANVEVVPKLLTPAKYGDPKMSGLTVEVKSGSNDIPLTLLSTP